MKGSNNGHAMLTRDSLDTLRRTPPEELTRQPDMSIKVKPDESVLEAIGPILKTETVSLLTLIFSQDDSQIASGNDLSDQTLKAFDDEVNPLSMGPKNLKGRVPASEKLERLPCWVLRPEDTRLLPGRCGEVGDNILVQRVITLARAEEFQSSLKPKSPRTTIQIDVKWNPPPEGWTELNSDGSIGMPGSRGEWEPEVSSGTAMRNWIRGFTRRLGCADSLLAESWRLRDGLIMATAPGRVIKTTGRY